MTEVTAALVKELRERTGAPIMDCRKALGESGADIEAAIDWLRKKGLSAAVKKAGRVAADGLVGAAVEGPIGALVEVNSETDFVARNEAFQRFVQSVSALALKGAGTLEALKSAPYPGAGHSVEAELTRLIAAVGENLVLRRVTRLAVDRGAVFSYVHAALGKGVGRIGVILALASTAQEEALKRLGKGLSMHIAAAVPLYLDIASVPKEELQRERSILIEQARATGKPEAILERMVEGRLKKFYEEVVLSEQIYVVDGETKVSRLVEEAAKEAGAAISLAGFARFALGEGILRPKSDFAASVKAQLKD